MLEVLARLGIGVLVGVPVVLILSRFARSGKAASRALPDGWRESRISLGLRIMATPLAALFLFVVAKIIFPTAPPVTWFDLGSRVAILPLCLGMAWFFASPWFPRLRWSAEELWVMTYVPLFSRHRWEDLVSLSRANEKWVMSFRDGRTAKVWDHFDDVEAVLYRARTELER